LLLTVPASATVMDLRLEIYDLLGLISGSTNEALDAASKCERTNNASKLPIYLSDSSGLYKVPQEKGDSNVVNHSISGFDNISGTEKYRLGSDDTEVLKALNEPLTFLVVDWSDSKALPEDWVYTEDLFQTEKHKSYDEYSRNKIDQPVRLQQCLQHFLKPEQLDEGNAWFCPKCKEDQQAFKSIEIRRLPDVLILFLKRFEHSTRSRNKLQTLIDFPLSNLDMYEHLAEDIREAGEASFSTLYDLYAVTNHFGSLGFGHYTAYCATELDASQASHGWCEFDDSRVVKGLKESDICTSAAYVLYYRRRKS